MASEEKLRVTEAWEYFKHRTGVQIERRAFFSWIEAGFVKIDGQDYELASNQINNTHFISRASIDRVIEALQAKT